MTLEEFKTMLKRRMDTEFVKEFQVACKLEADLDDFDEGFYHGGLAVMSMLPGGMSEEMMQYWEDLYSR